TADRARADDADTHAHGRGAYRGGGPVTMLMGGPEMAPQTPQRFTRFQRSAVHTVATPSGLTVAAPQGAAALTVAALSGRRRLGLARPNGRRRLALARP